jgi:hypothetical protein
MTSTLHTVAIEAVRGGRYQAVCNDCHWKGLHEDTARLAEEKSANHPAESPRLTRPSDVADASAGPGDDRGAGAAVTRWLVTRTITEYASTYVDASSLEEAIEKAQGAGDWDFVAYATDPAPAYDAEDTGESADDDEEPDHSIVDPTACPCGDGSCDGCDRDEARA